MVKKLVFCVLAAATLCVHSVSVSAQTTQTSPTRQVTVAPDNATAAGLISLYVKGLQDGRASTLTTVFDPQSYLHSISRNSLGRTSGVTFARGVGLGGMFRFGRASATPRPQASIPRLDVDAKAGVAQIELDPGNDGITDYLMIARIGSQWRIISKVFEDPKALANADLTAARRPIEAFIASRADWDSDKLSAAVFDKAQIFSNVGDQLIDATVDQTSQSYTRARQENRAGETSGPIESIETLGTVGYGRWHTVTATGARKNWVACILKTPTEWRIISLYGWDAPS